MIRPTREMITMKQKKEGPDDDDEVMMGIV